MIRLWTLVRGGFLKQYRAQVLGVAAALGGLVQALAQWTVGDLAIVSLIRAVSENWAVIAGGLGVATLGTKIDRTDTSAKQAGETVSDIADRALRR